MRSNITKTLPYIGVAIVFLGIGVLFGTRAANAQLAKDIVARDEPREDEVDVEAGDAESHYIEIYDIVGDVSYSDKQTTSDLKDIGGIDVLAGVQFVTGAGSAVKLGLPDGAELYIAENTEVSFDLIANPEYNTTDTLLVIEQGAVIVHVSLMGGNTFRMIDYSGSRDATVVGSIMGLWVDPDKGVMKVACFEGDCKFSLVGLFTQYLEGSLDGYRDNAGDELGNAHGVWSDKENIVCDFWLSLFPNDFGLITLICKPLPTETPEATETSEATATEQGDAATSTPTPDSGAPTAAPAAATSTKTPKPDKPEPTDPPQDH